MDKLDRLIALHEISNLKARYFRAIDSKDKAALLGIIADDAVLDYRGSATDPGSGINLMPEATEIVLDGREIGLDQIVAQMMKTVEGLVTVHQAGLSEVEITGEDSAAAVWQYFDQVRFPAGAGVREFVGFGYSADTYERIDGHWKLKSVKLSRLRLDMIPE